MDTKKELTKQDILQAGLRNMLEGNNPEEILTYLKILAFDLNAIRIILNKGNLKVIKMIYSHSDKFLDLAIMDNHLIIVEFLLTDIRKKKNCCQFENVFTNAIKTAFATQHLEIIRWLIDFNHNNYEAQQLALYAAIAAQNIFALKLLMDDDRVDVDKAGSRHTTLPITQAVRTGNIEIVRCFLEDDRIDPTVNQNQVFNVACELGLNEMVDFLLADKRIKPSWVGLYIAIEKQYEAIAITLLNYPDNHFSLNDVLVQASTYGCGKVVRFLLKNPEVNPGYHRSESLRNACKHSHLDGRMEVINILLEDKRAQPQAFASIALRFAVDKSSNELTKKLLEDGRVDVNARTGYAIKEAKYPALVLLLIKTEKVKPEHIFEKVKSMIINSTYNNQRNNRLIKKCIQHGKIDFEKSLSIARHHAKTEIFTVLALHSPLSLEQLKRNAYTNWPDNSHVLQASKLLNTCGLFRLAEPALIKDITFRIGSIMMDLTPSRPQKNASKPVNNLSSLGVY